MILDLEYEHSDFIRDVIPFIRNGIFIDTSVMKIFLDGFIELRFSKKQNRDFQNLISLLDFLKMQNKLNKFFITPHIFTEICSHLHRDYNKRTDYDKIIKEVVPILFKLKENKEIDKDEILDCVDLRKPIVEIGDISIFLSVDKIANENEKTAILVKDVGFNNRYINDSKIMIIDFDKTILSLSQL